MANEKLYDDYLHICIQKELKEDIKKIAYSKNMTPSEYIRTVLLVIAQKQQLEEIKFKKFCLEHCIKAELIRLEED